MVKLVVATHNLGKLREIKAVIAEFADVSGIASAGELGLEDVKETGTSLQENSRLKAEFVCKQTNLPALADDSGLIVSAMGNAPGIFSARWAGGHGDDKANRALLLEQLADIPASARAARFETCCILAYPSGDIAESAGVTLGSIGFEEIGENGFGYDSIFIPEAFPKFTLAQLELSEKNSISHRAQAVNAMKTQLIEILS